MVHLTSSQFRTVVAATIVLLCISEALSVCRLVTYPADIETARSWQHFGSILTRDELLALYMLLLTGYASGLIGVLCFWGAARWVLAATIALGCAMQPLMGLHVLSAFEATLATLHGVLIMWILIVSFWSPLADHFQAEQRVASEGTEGD